MARRDRDLGQSFRSDATLDEMVKITTDNIGLPMDRPPARPILPIAAMKLELDAAMFYFGWRPLLAPLENVRYDTCLEIGIVRLCSANLLYDSLSAVRCGAFVS